MNEHEYDYSATRRLGRDFDLRDYRDVESALESLTDMRNGLALGIARGLRFTRSGCISSKQLEFLEDLNRQIAALRPVLDCFDVDEDPDNA